MDRNHQTQASDPKPDPSSGRFCQLGEDHSQKEVVMICLNPECDARRLCCLACIDDFHQKHELISLAKFESMLSQLNPFEANTKLQAKGSVQSKKDIEEIIREKYASVKTEANQALQRCINEYKAALVGIDAIFDGLLERIIERDNQVKYVEEFYSDFTAKQAQKYYKKIQESKSDNFRTVDTAQMAFQKSDKIVKTMVKEFESNFSKATSALNKHIENIKKCLKQDKFKPFEVKFSLTNKAQCLEVSQNRMVTKRISGSGGYPINLMEQPLTRENNSVKIRITEQPGNKGIWMGIALLDIVKSKNFLGCYGLTKGTYAIDQVGANHASAFSWSHHDSAYNSQPKVVFLYQSLFPQGFQFHVGETVTIKVDFDKAVVTFSKGFQTYSQPIKLDLGEFYAFAGPTNMGDALTLDE